MTKKPRMGSDPLQKKDPLAWIGSDQADKASQQEGVPSQQGNSDELSKHGKPSIQRQLSKAGNLSKQDLPKVPSTPDDLDGPSNPSKVATTSKGLRPGWTRATFIVREETVQQLKAVAYWDRKELKRVVEEAFSQYLVGKDVPEVPENKD